ncbi:MarR family transcriptional regulator [Micromonospora aurantiaca (nom. illeg.)]|uniref:MarR family transcriptional regulator n=1 Tax=Micromonospora aurantiaca (nom. illeg.) TaxID=47850 RepID=UPI00379D7C0E
MTDTPETPPAHAMFKVLAALGELGDATAAAVAAHAGVGYSTATAKLRAWEQTGQTEKIHIDGKGTLWRLTDTGRATTATPNPPQPVADTGQGEPEQPDTTGPPQPDDEAVPPDGRTDDQDPPVTEVPAPPEAVAPSAAAEEHPPSTEDQQDQRPDPAPGPDTGGETAAAADRRPKGSLRGAVLDILEAHPDRQYKTGELCKLIDAANAGTGARKASAGAVHNAAIKLVAAGQAVQTVEKPATFQYAPTTGSR